MLGKHQKCLLGLKENYGFEKKKTKLHQTLQFSLRSFEPKHDKTSKTICAPSEDSDQHGHPSSLTRVFAVRSVGSYKDPRFLHADNADSDQIEWMPRLTRVFTGCTGHSVGFAMQIFITFCRVKGLCVLQ